jgi:hypothetical protein
VTRPTPPDGPEGPAADDPDGAPARPRVPPEEMGGDPACWLGLVEDWRDADAEPDADAP